MTRLNKIAFAAVAFTFVVTLIPTAEACGRGRGYSSGNPARRPKYNFSGVRPTHNYRPAPSYRAPVQSTPVFTPAPVVTQPTPQPVVVAQPTAPAPQPVVTPQPAPVQTTPVQTTPAATPTNAMDAALQALGGFAPEPTTPAQPVAPQHIGTFNADLGNGARVALTLNADGQFTWAATNAEGRTSSFSGSYNIGSESLTLVRGNDNQQLNGGLTGLSANGFEFKIGDGAALNFVRG